MLRLTAAVFLVLASSCAPAPAPSSDAIQAPGDSDREVTTDVSDRCGILRAGCPGIEDDGCPDVMIDLDQGCDHERTRKIIAELAQALSAEPRFTRVAVRGDPNLASCIASRLTAAGIEPGRVEAQNDKRAYVVFEVVAWSGAACR